MFYLRKPKSFQGELRNIAALDQKIITTTFIVLMQFQKYFCRNLPTVYAYMAWKNVGGSTYTQSLVS
jgi:hypothetical protein